MRAPCSRPGIFDIYFRGEIGTLSTIAKAPVVQRMDEQQMLAYFGRVQPPGGKLFTGGLAWANRKGIVRVSTNTPKVGDIADVSDRSYFRQTIADRQAVRERGAHGPAQRPAGRRHRLPDARCGGQASRASSSARC